MLPTLSFKSVLLDVGWVGSSETLVSSADILGAVNAQTTYPKMLGVEAS